ncbi:LLM class flavin-dependent oxidoreductase [Yinghuangia soli]|uniref:LLM class flavin-dependent oxidoreductase n=1 Tax=Yinghuangia soli TaxID=2908204 RepID=A0AA41Q7B8_9ACTN|nr:LLM class flavin-dependent oxidoreductase [Yinghuangia soli]MCF2531507.1 LLM class flavin-dependent oxidoreductase [Yinghuangia soli]
MARSAAAPLPAPAPAPAPASASAQEGTTLHQSASPARFTAMVNHAPRSGGRTGPGELLTRAREAEAAGYDVLSLADWSAGEVFAPLALVAQATTEAQLMTRIVAAPTRSPTLLASGAAWIDRISGGRFTLGLGAGVAELVRRVHALPWQAPRTRMGDTLEILRALWGEPVDGAEADEHGAVTYRGKAISVQGALIDTLPERRIPVVLAADGPRMLRLAGARADGIVLEMTTPAFLHWALDQARAGAAAVGRDLDADRQAGRFEVCVQSLWPSGDDERHRSWVTSYHVDHCVWPEFAGHWTAAGLADAAAAVREAHAGGDRREAARLAEKHLLPDLVVAGGEESSAADLTSWVAARRHAGASLFAVPDRLDRFARTDLDRLRAAVGTDA